MIIIFKSIYFKRKPSNEFITHLLLTITWTTVDKWIVNFDHSFEIPSEVSSEEIIQILSQNPFVEQNVNYHRNKMKIQHTWVQLIRFKCATRKTINLWFESQFWAELFFNLCGIFRQKYLFNFNLVFHWLI